MDAVHTAVVGSACSCVLEASDHEDRSSDVCYVSETRQSFSAKKLTALHTHHSFSIVSHRNIMFSLVDQVRSRNIT